VAAGLATLTFVALFLVSSRRSMWRKELVLVWVAALVSIGVLMWGGIFGLSYVSQDRWGGLPVTLILATFGLAFGFPLGIVVALGRRSKAARDPLALRVLCRTHPRRSADQPAVHGERHVSAVHAGCVNIDKLLRAQIAFVLFAGAYLAEVIRGGLQAVPRGQHEAAEALGLSYWKKERPDHSAAGDPPCDSAAGEYVHRVLQGYQPGPDHRIFDLLTTAKTAIIDPAWQSFRVEVYLFVGLIYFAFCFAMSRYSHGLEAQRRST